MRFIKKYWIITTIYFIPLAYCILRYILRFQCVFVEETYIDVVYGAQITLSIILITVLTLISSSISERYIGFSFRDIMNFKSYKVKHKTFIGLSLINILINTVLYMFKLIDAVTSMLLISVLLAIIYSFNIVNFITGKDEYLENLIDEEVQLICLKGETDLAWKYVTKIELYIDRLSDIEITNGSETFAWDMHGRLLHYLYYIQVGITNE